MMLLINANSLDGSAKSPERRLVKNEAASVPPSGPPDREHLLLAAREVPGAMALALREARKDAEYTARGSARAVLRTTVAAEVEIFSHAHIGEDAPASGHVDQACETIADAWRARSARRQSVIGREWSQHTGDRTVERGFPAPLEPSTRRFTRGNRKVDAAQDFGRAVSGMQLVMPRMGSAIGGPAHAAGRA